jgi:hypothetical protein
MCRIRQFHLYLGVFFAPMIIFFALSGALQTFRLQEEKGWGGTPPDWIVWMAAVHKDSSLPRPKPSEAAGPAPTNAHHVVEANAGSPVAKPAAAPATKKARKSRLPMQIFAAALSIGLIFSALLGMAIAINARPTRRLSILMAIAGTILPIVLLKL